MDKVVSWFTSNKSTTKLYGDRRVDVAFVGTRNTGKTTLFRVFEWVFGKFKEKHDRTRFVKGVIMMAAQVGTFIAKNCCPSDKRFMTFVNSLDARSLYKALPKVKKIYEKYQEYSKDHNFDIFFDFPMFPLFLEFQNIFSEDYTPNFSDYLRLYDDDENEEMFTEFVTSKMTFTIKCRPTHR